MSTSYSFIFPFAFSPLNTQIESLLSFFKIIGKKKKAHFFHTHNIYYNIIEISQEFKSNHKGGNWDSKKNFHDYNKKKISKIKNFTNKKKNIV